MMTASKRREISESLKTNATKSIYLYTEIEKCFESLEENNDPDNMITVIDVDMTNPHYDEVLEYMETLGYTVIKKQLEDDDKHPIYGYYDIIISW